MQAGWMRHEEAPAQSAAAAGYAGLSFEFPKREPTFLRQGVSRHTMRNDDATIAPMIFEASRVINASEQALSSESQPH